MLVSPYLVYLVVIIIVLVVSIHWPYIDHYLKAYDSTVTLTPSKSIDRLSIVTSMHELCKLR